MHKLNSQLGNNLCTDEQGLVVSGSRPGSAQQGPITDQPVSGQATPGRPGSGRPLSDRPGSGRPSSDRPGSGRPPSGRPKSRTSDHQPQDGNWHYDLSQEKDFKVNDCSTMALICCINSEVIHSKYYGSSIGAMFRVLSCKFPYCGFEFGSVCLWCDFP